MNHPMHTPAPPTVALIGASRGIGHAMAAEFVTRGWQVLGTVRAGVRTPLHALAEAHPGRVEIAELDICLPEQIHALQRSLAGQRFDCLFVNAGTANRDPDQRIGRVSAEEFLQVMLTNALAPMRVIEALEELVAADGLIGVMSSGQGSIANNEKGGRELYRGSKAALNMFMRSYAARQAGSARALLVMAPGWIRTALGGPDAPFSLDDNIPSLMNVLLAQRGRPGLQYLDYRGQTVPW